MHQSSAPSPRSHGALHHSPLPCRTATWPAGGGGGKVAARHTRDKAPLYFAAPNQTVSSYPRIIVTGIPIAHAPEGAVLDWGTGAWYTPSMDGASTQRVSLEELAQEAREVPGRFVPRGGAIQKVRYSHDAMIDLIIQKPWITQNELAAEFGYTAGWISQVIAADAFQARLAERKEEIVDPAIKATVEERFKALVIRSLQILQEKLDRPSNQIPDNLAIKTMEMGAKALGYGASVHLIPPAPPPATDRLNALGERLVGLLHSSRERDINGESLRISEVKEAEVVSVRPSDPARGEGSEGPKPNGHDPSEGAVRAD